MRLSLAAAICLSAIATTAWAQDGGAAPAPSDAAAKAIWCGAAFAIAGKQKSAEGDDAGAKDYADKASAAFATAASELVPEGMTVAQFQALAEAAAAEVTAPFRQTSYTEAECTTAR